MKNFFVKHPLFTAMLAGLLATTLFITIYAYPVIIFIIPVVILCLPSLATIIGLPLFLFLRNKIKPLWLTPIIVGLLTGIIPVLVMVVVTQIQDFTINFDALFKKDDWLGESSDYRLDTNDSWHRFFLSLGHFGGLGVIYALTAWTVWMRLKGYPFRQKPEELS